MRRLTTVEAPVWFKHRAWIPVAWLLSVVNLAAVWFAAQPAEPWHATIHALLAVGFALGAQRLRARQRPEAIPDQLRQTLELNEQLQEDLSVTQVRLHELEERVDFAERLIATQRDAERLGAPPGRPEQPERR